MTQGHEDAHLNDPEHPVIDFKVHLHELNGMYNKALELVYLFMQKTACAVELKEAFLAPDTPYGFLIGRCQFMQEDFEEGKRHALMHCLSPRFHDGLRTK